MRCNELAHEFADHLSSRPILLATSLNKGPTEFAVDADA